MEQKPETDPPESHQDAKPRPRLWWLAAFHVAVIALVVALARLTRDLAPRPLLEDRLGGSAEAPLGEGSFAEAAGQAALSRGWSVATVAMVGALLLMLPIVWAYVATRERRKVDHSVVTTITLLPLAVAAILVIVQDSLAVAFSLAGIAGLVRFRNALDDTKDAMYVFVAIAVGLGAGVGALEASAALSGLYNLVVVALWKWNTVRPAIADIALGEQEQVVLSDRERERHPPPTAEWLEPSAAVPLVGAAPAGEEQPVNRREGMLRVYVADDPPTRQHIEEILTANTKRWSLESTDPGPDDRPALTYQVRLKKRLDSAGLLEVLHRDLGPSLAEYSPAPPPPDGASSADRG